MSTVTTRCTDNPLTQRVLAVLTQCGHTRRPNWESMLRHSLQTYPAIFAQPAFAKHYRLLAADADWFADSLVANACLEGYGARQILAFADRLSDPAQAEQARRHALDESRHSSVFVFMLNLVFPGLLAAQETATREQIRAMQPMLTALDATRRPPDPTASYLSPADALSEIIQVHITEIRALVLQDLVREALLRHAPAINQTRLLRISDRLIVDEGRHIAYCADIIESAAAQDSDCADALHEAFASHLCNFNLMTLDELERQSIEL